MMTIGDIYTVEIPSSDGHEQACPRPAIIVQTPKFETQLPTVLIIPLTSQLAAQAFPGTFLIPPRFRKQLDHALRCLGVSVTRHRQKTPQAQNRKIERFTFGTVAETREGLAGVAVSLRCKKSRTLILMTTETVCLKGPCLPVRSPHLRCTNSYIVRPSSLYCF